MGSIMQKKVILALMYTINIGYGVGGGVLWVETRTSRNVMLTDLQSWIVVLIVTID
jgi:hypothetical protein